MASVVTRTRGILRRCAPQDDRGESVHRGMTLICHSERNNVERRISRLRVRPTGRLRKGGAPSRGPGQLLLDLRPNSPSRALRDGSIPRAGQSEAGRTGAHCAPLRGGTHSPSCCKGKRVASVLRENVFTREARPEGKGVDSQEGENRRCSPSCAQCGRAGRVPARDARAQTLRLSRRIPPYFSSKPNT